MKPKKRSPLRDKPLRYAGQSLDDLIQDKRSDIASWILAAVVYFVLTATAWFGYKNPSPRTLLVMTGAFGAFAIVTAVWAVYKVIVGYRDIARLRLGRDGEKLVAEGLQDLIADGAAILNDIQAKGFNLDHVVISRHGVFLIETKTYSKPVGQQSEVRFDEENVYIGGRRVDRNPLKQARASAKWLEDLLRESTGRRFKVRPTIVFPGWFVERMQGAKDVWVLNPKALPVFIKKEPIMLSDPDVHLVTFHLSRYVRSDLRK